MSSYDMLLVDDEKEFVETIARRLLLRGIKVDCAFSGTEALLRLEKDDSVDVVVLDIGMPGFDGIKTVEILKSKHPLVEVIMLTGYATVDSAVDALKLGAFDYLIKPCDLDELIDKAQKAASRKKKREAKILEIRMKPYISERERDELLAHILEGDQG